MPRSLFDIQSLTSHIDKGHLLLTPNIRLARRIAGEWNTQRMAAGDEVWQPVPVFPIEHWLMQRWEQAVSEEFLPAQHRLTQPQEVELWKQIIVAAASEGTTSSLISPASAALLAAQARDLMLRWELDSSDASYCALAQLDEDSRTFSLWLEMFNRYLEERELCTTADCINQLNSVEGMESVGGVVLVECQELPPLIASCLGRHARDVATVLSTAQSALCTAHSFAEQREELGAVAKWAAQRHQEEAEATIGIVLGGGAERRVTLEYFLRREFGCLGENYASLPVNISAGISLLHTPVIRDAMSLLELSEGRVSVEAIVRLFQSRFIALSDRESAVAQYFIRSLYDGGSSDLEVAELRNFACTVKFDEATGLEFGNCLLTVSGMRDLDQRTRPSNWVASFHAVLDAWGWPGQQPLDSLEYQQVQLWYEVLDEYGGMDAVCADISFVEACRLLRESVAAKISHPQTADSCVQVLGPLEAAGLSFDYLWVCGMQASAWPPAPQPNPLIPLRLQVERQMPHADAGREWEYAVRLLEQFRRNASELHASYALQIDNAPDLPSPLIETFELAAAEVPQIAAPNATWQSRYSEAAKEVLDDAVAPPLQGSELEAVRGGAALIEAQSQCPFRAFARYRLGAEALSDFAVGVSPAERGDLVHNALQALWGKIGDHATLLSLVETDVDAHIANAAKIAFEQMPGFRRRALGPACLELESERLCRLLDEWLKIELSRGEFVVSAREESVELPLSGLRIELRVDRIDQLPDGRSMIVDYKTGKAKSADWLGERPPKPQLLLYALASPTSPAALAFAQLRPNECGYVGLGSVEDVPGIVTDIPKALKNKMAAQNWEELNDAWATTLRRLAQAFVDGRAEVLPLANACTWCGLQALCRVGARAEDVAS